MQPQQEIPLQRMLRLHQEYTKLSSLDQLHAPITPADRQRMNDLRRILTSEYHAKLPSTDFFAVRQQQTKADEVAGFRIGITPRERANETAYRVNEYWKAVRTGDMSRAVNLITVLNRLDGIIPRIPDSVRTYMRNRGDGEYLAALDIAKGRIIAARSPQGAVRQFMALQQQQAQAEKTGMGTTISADEMNIAKYAAAYGAAMQNLQEANGTHFSDHFAFGSLKSLLNPNAAYDVAEQMGAGQSGTRVDWQTNPTAAARAQLGREYLASELAQGHAVDRSKPLLQRLWQGTRQQSGAVANSLVNPFLTIGRGVVIAANGYDPGWQIDLGGGESVNKTWNVLSSVIPVAGAEKLGAGITEKLLTKALARKIGTEAAELAVKGKLTDAAARQSLGLLKNPLAPKMIISAGGALGANVPIQLQLGVQGHDSPAELRQRLLYSTPTSAIIGAGVPYAQGTLSTSTLLARPAAQQLGQAGIEVAGEVGNSMNNFIADPHRKGSRGWQTALGEGVRDGLVKAAFLGREPVKVPRKLRQPRLGWGDAPTVVVTYERLTPTAPIRAGEMVSWTTGSGTHYGTVEKITRSGILRVRKPGVKNTVGLLPTDAYRVVFPTLGQ